MTLDAYPVMADDLAIVDSLHQEFDEIPIDFIKNQINLRMARLRIIRRTNAKVIGFICYSLHFYTDESIDTDKVFPDLLPGCRNDCTLTIDYLFLRPDYRKLGIMSDELEDLADEFLSYVAPNKVERLVVEADFVSLEGERTFNWFAEYLIDTAKENGLNIRIELEAGA